MSKQVISYPITNAFVSELYHFHEHFFSGDGREEKKLCKLLIPSIVCFFLSPLELMRYLFTQTIEVVHIQLTVVSSHNGICHICFRSICVACNQNLTQSMLLILYLHLSLSLYYNIWIHVSSEYEFTSFSIAFSLRVLHSFSRCAYLSVSRCVWNAIIKIMSKTSLISSVPKHVLKLKSLFKWFAMQIFHLTCI